MQTASDDLSKTLEDNLELVEQILSRTSRRYRFSPVDAEELRSITFLKLVEDDYAVLRKFRGTSSLRTYLTTVIQRLALDYRNKEWGKWRPSRKARRMGDVAVQLESLISRDGYSVSQAIEISRAHQQVPIEREELERIAGRLPARVRRRFEPVAVLQNLAAPESADAAFWQSARNRHKAKIQRRLLHLVATLPAEERLILKLRFESGLQVSQIAARLGLAQRPLYDRIARCLRGLRRDLRDEGVTRELIARSLAGP